ncbi:MAG: N-succinylarginine dihydrolase [Gammaproteobacteria bacterium CG22_combo_CG10-13_8_21_14_all_40_8]|nr:MAG: N-succinylarginine dihydrolase [Gammaproteobacteria bacterium CG22_combo_CG10-13_8_21_14_all_40_8]
MTKQAYEINFDGLVGPTHNYAGLSVGNVASLNSASSASNPKEGALQGLDKMKALHDMGFKQGIIPPLERPDIHTLKALGFRGTDTEIITKVAKEAPKLLVAVSSASSMWTANACTMSPSADSQDQKVHFTPANLSNKFHRSIEWKSTGNILKALFADNKYFTHHDALPSGDHFGDEGAANHTRFCDQYGDVGLQFFVFGKYAFDANQPMPRRFPARQTFEASQSITRLHYLNQEHCVFAQQNPETIDMGVFHNDVIAVGNGNVLFFHEQAFLNKQAVINELNAKYPGSKKLQFIEVKQQDVSVSDAVSSYLFNSQLLSKADGSMMLICPSECQTNVHVNRYLEQLTQQDKLISEVKIYDVKQSMRNGGGPACLRQRIVLTEAELQAMNQHCLLTPHLYKTLQTWVKKHYRDRICEADLADPQLLVESRRALDELTKILHLGNIYPFQC